MLLADGHVAAIAGTRFPRGLGGSASLADLQQDNAGETTVFADPRAALGY